MQDLDVFSDISFLVLRSVYLPFLQFDVEFYHRIRADSNPSQSRSDFTFYGLKQNARLAGYSYRIFFDRIQVQSLLYKDPAAGSRFRKSSATRTARVSYCFGCTVRMQDSVGKAVKARAKEREERLTLARLRAQRREAALRRGNERLADESCHADDLLEFEGSIESSAGSNGSLDENDGEDEEDSGRSRAELALRRARAKVEKLEREESNSKALVVQTRNAPDLALKNANVKIQTGKKRKYSSAFDVAAYTQGHEDAAAFDLNRQAIENK